MSISIVVTTCRDDKEARKISDSLIEKRIAACVKTGNTNSSYVWEDKIVKVKEVVLSATTDRKKVQKVIDEIKSLHSYEVPEIIELPVKRANKKYERWVSSVVK